MTIYQKELLKQLSKCNCTGQIDNENGMLNISANSLPLCIAGKKGDLYWDKDKLITQEHMATIDTLCDTAKTIREYVSLYESSPPLGVDTLPEYRKLAEYGDIVLGAMYSEKYGFMFSTWHQSKDRNYVIQGDYTQDYEYAKESFAVRSGLTDKNRLFTLEEAENLYRCIEYVRENCETLTYDQERQLKDLSEGKSACDSS